MKSYRWAAPALLALAGCSNIETAMTIRHVAEPDDMCKVEADGTGVMLDITFDTALGDTLFLMMRVFNNLQAGTVMFGTDDIPDNFRLPNQITPVRFDLRWECDSNGFSDDLGDLFVPQFSADQPFCISDDTRTFAGFDVIPASGGAIEPESNGVVEIRPITAQLGAAFNDVFELAKKAQACCDAAGGCDDASLQNAPNGPNTACGDLQTAFDVIAGPNKLSAQSFADVQKFRPFLVFDHAAVPPRGPNNIAPAYTMVLRGVLEGVTADGSVVSSGEFRQTVHICANCSQTPCTNF